MLPMKFIRNGVVTMTAPGMASEDAAHTEVETLEGTMAEDGFHHILATRRSVAASGRGQRTDAPLVEADGEDEGATEEVTDGLVAHGQSGWTPGCGGGE